MSHQNINTQQADFLNANSAGIPLHCNVCPKKPDFSDVSHLLTHIASKGHLSNYYKLKIKAASDRAAQRVTQEYDEWYEMYNVQELMGERMKQKEKRKGSNGGGGGGTRRGSGVPSTARNTLAFPAYNRRQGLRESTLDPQLGPRIKVEPDSRSGTPVSALSIDPATLSRAFMPPMLQSWPTTPYADSPMTQEHSVFDSIDNDPSSDYEDFESPKKSRPRRRARAMSESNECSIFGEEEELLEYDDGLKEGTRLKGVHWKGMGIFDAATLEMRRKRNQKKAYSVIQSLMATSEVVEPNEMVFDSDWELQREREITGNPNEDDDGGPLRGESSPEVDTPPLPKRKKQATRRSRPALAQKNVNNGRALRQRSSHHPGFNRGDIKPYYDGQEDDDLTYGMPRPRKRSGLSIHRDNTGPEITFNNPSSMNTLTSGFRPRSSGSAAQDQGMFQNGRSSFNRNYTHQRLPSLSAIGGNNSFRPANPTNFGNFGQFNGQSFFPSNQFNQNPFASMMGGAGALTAFQQHMGSMGLGQQNPFGGDGGMFHAQTQNLVQPTGA